MDWETISAIALLLTFFAIIPQPDTAIAGGIDEAKEPEVVVADTLDVEIFKVPHGWESVDYVAAEVVYLPVSAGNQIDELFDYAWADGTKTYAGLIEYVRSSTGKGTSKTRVKAWKEKRGLLDE